MIMKLFFKNHYYLTVATILTLYAGMAHSQNLKDFEHHDILQPLEHTVQSQIQFNGYTNYWHDTYRNWYRLGICLK